MSAENAQGAAEGGAEGRASDFIGGGRRGKVGRTLRAGSPVSQQDTAESKEPKARTVRYTVDLDPELHRVLKISALDAGAKSAEVVRALLEELRDDPALTERVQQRMQG